MNVAGIFITGSTDGAHVLIHGRDAARAQALIEEIAREGHPAPIFY
jgi:hypothetical protein